jgi:hypothetical protein
MNVAEGSTIINVVLILVGLAIGWTILKAILKLTMRLFAIGCLVIFVLVGLGWIIGLIG